MSDADVIIAGGGLVGASLALALGGTGRRVAVVEPLAPSAEAQPSFDDRQTALAPTSRRFLEALGLWEALQDEAGPITEIHVSDRGGFGFTRLTAAAEGLPALGHVVPNRALGAVLGPALAEAEHVSLYCPAEVAGVRRLRDRVEVSLSGEGAPATMSAPLLVVADGMRSATREAIGVGLRERPYGQTAIIANLRTEYPLRGRAFERFTPDGPLAVLPLADDAASLVWTLPGEQADAVAALPEPEFLARLQQAFGWRLGRLQAVGERHCYPLTAVIAERFSAERAAIIGNAAHALHPVAGQGLNLALRDVAALAELIAEPGDPGDAERLARFERERRGDYRRTFVFTDGLVRLFSNRWPPLALLRNVGLTALDLVPPARRFLLQQATGRAGRLPRLSRGLPLAREAP
ncbi:2-octaprenyl-6-methoxyphenyl hydroxylase [Sediminicurvatus halobius]|uniref:2-octaprenyl-6-methoxyphenyl hydroxylase n=1 Tax=Sediminicurvatus halobius TaxID=2182432 RepID=A0A2U2N1N9_9GAMM|nr:2-octaprenyl-6-methoxyphenyl hydroxylase [Spiribacter halobius]PWG62968.1 2-octaprenyl-6-methoxyphenyl hydroxylase [Spiribacter halobius]UEX77482.1 2-octaprenyl-6-methoxyphenyl hydroxylase [Spiribacter halobius]